MIGVRIIESWEISKMVEDWSEVRSPSRAVRRLRQGHKQRVKRMKVPADPIYDKQRNIIYAHPEHARILRQQVGGAGK